MNKIKKLSIAFLALAMVALLGVTAFAVDGTTGADYSVYSDTTSTCVSNTNRTATVTFMANKEIDLFSFDAKFELPTGWEVVEFVNTTLNLSFDDYDTENNRIVWLAPIDLSSADLNVTTQVLAMIKVNIPGGTPAGEYTIKMKEIELAKINVSATGFETPTVEIAELETKITIKEHSYTLDINEGESGYAWAKNGDAWTCTAYGKCICGATITAAGNVTPTVETGNGATCIAMGKTTYTARFTEAWASTQTKTETDIPKIAHNYSGKPVSNGNGKDATHSYKCVSGLCGTTGVGNVEGATEQHTWDEGIVNPAPDCTNPGTKTYTCKVDDCDATYTEPVDATGHNFTGEINNDGEKHSFKCVNANCNEYGNAEDHTYDQEDGTKCECGAVKPATGLKGDVDLSGEVDLNDLVALAQHIGESVIITNSESLANAEVTGEGDVDLNDLVKIAQYIGETIDSLD